MSLAAVCEKKGQPSFGLYTLDPCQDGRWTRFLERRPDASVFHTVGWLQALRITYGYEPVVYTTSSPGGELNDGVLFCGIKALFSGRRLVSVPFSDHATLLVDDFDALQRIFSGLQATVHEGIHKYVEIRPATQLSLDLMGFCESAVFCWHRLFLDKELDALYGTFHKKSVQRRIRRAQREGLTYAEGRSEELIQQFYHLLVFTRRRHGLPPQPIAWFRNLVQSLGDMIKIRVASTNGVPVASIITLAFGKSMVYKYGCSDANYHRLGGISFLLWESIKDAKSNGLEELDLGRSDLDNSGLITFKEHWGARRSTLVYWGYPTKLRSDVNRWDFRLARRVFRRLPIPALLVAGKLLYKHVG
jgi:hypothetical protein